MDETWFDEDGREWNSRGNNSNIFRLWAPVKEGLVIDEGGTEIEQVCRLTEIRDSTRHIAVRLTDMRVSSANISME